MKSSSQFKKIMLYLLPADMRKQVMGLAEMVENILDEDPFEDCLYLFCNRRRDIVKGIYFDRAGFCLWMKKLDREKFPWLKAQDGKIERKIKHAATGRKAWLFCTSIDGANASAAIFSILMTAQENGLQPYDYLIKILSAPESTPIGQLLPFN